MNNRRFSLLLLLMVLFLSCIGLTSVSAQAYRLQRVNDEGGGTYEYTYYRAGNADWQKTVESQFVGKSNYFKTASQFDNNQAASDWWLFSIRFVPLRELYIVFNIPLRRYDAEVSGVVTIETDSGKRQVATYRAKNEEMISLTTTDTSLGRFSYRGRTDSNENFCFFPTNECLAQHIKSIEFEHELYMDGQYWGTVSYTKDTAGGLKTNYVPMGQPSFAWSGDVTLPLQLTGTAPCGNNKYTYSGSAEILSGDDFSEKNTVNVTYEFAKTDVGSDGSLSKTYAALSRAKSYTSAVHYVLNSAETSSVYGMAETWTGGPFSYTLMPYTSPRNVSVTFNQWQRKATVRWSKPGSKRVRFSNDPAAGEVTVDHNTSGKWVVTRWLKSSGSSSPEVTVVGQLDGSASKLEVTDDAEFDYDCQYVYRVLFLPAILSGLSADEQSGLAKHGLGMEQTLSTQRSVPIRLAQDRSEEGGVKLVWQYSIPESDSEFVVEYEDEMGIWRELDTQPVNTRKSQAFCVDHSSKSACDFRNYRVRVSCLGTEFTSNVLRANLPGATYITKVDASKGTREGSVVVKWNVVQRGTDETVFRILRRPVSGGDDWTEVGTARGTASEYSYTDDRVAAGTYYEYTVQAYGATCDEQVVQTDTKLSPGFSQASGTITGHISFGSGTSVQGVRVHLVKSAEGDDGSQFFSRRIEGEGEGLAWMADSAKYSKVLNGQHGLTAQLWVKPNDDGQDKMGLLTIPGTLELGLKRIGDSSGYDLQLPLEGAARYLTADGRYAIGSRTDWENYARLVSSGDNYPDAVMTADVDLGSSQVMIGLADHPYNASFDGNGHTLTVNYDNTLQADPYTPMAPFSHMFRGTVKNLRVTGTIKSKSQFVGGIIGRTTKWPGKTDWPIVAIDGCRSSVVIDSQVEGDGSMGGFVSVPVDYSETSINNCLFDGQLLGPKTHSCGGFVGMKHQHSVLRIVNSVFAPTAVTVGAEDSQTFARGYAFTLTNSFYVTALGGAQGTSMAGQDTEQLLAALGSDWVLDGNSLLPQTTTVEMQGGTPQSYTVSQVEQGRRPDGETADETATYQLYAVDLTSSTPKVKEFPALTFSPVAFTHLAAVYDGDSRWTFFVGSDSLASDVMTVAYTTWKTMEKVARITTDAAPAPTMTLGGSHRVSGTAFSGYVDDVRLWSRSLSRETIADNSTRILGGTEDGLTLYWPLDEGLQMVNYAFDVSRQDGLYNQNHPEVGINVQPSSVTPDALKLYGVTDQGGDYIIRGIPFTSGGTNYKIVPDLGIHTFNPANRSLFVSPTSLTANNVDFTDESAFTMTGYVHYAGTNLPAKGIQLYVDGTLQTVDGEVAQTGDNGRYTISVPIGEHYVEAKLNGHTMVGRGRFPATGRYNFDQPLTHNFADSTLVNFVGRVAGGDAEGKKPVGFGSSKNNIGVARLQLALNNPSFSFNCMPDRTTDNTERRPFDSDTTAINSHSYAGAGELSRYIYIETDSATGEFSAKLPPLKYQLRAISVPSNPELEFLSLGEVDLTNPLTQAKDSLKTVGENGDSITRFYNYNTKLVRTYYAQPQLDVVQQSPEDGTMNPLGAYGMAVVEDNEDDFGTATIDNIWTATDDGQVSYRFGQPVFQMKNRYAYKIHGYEAYVNNDRQPAVTDTVPMKGQVLTVLNEMTSDQKIVNRVEDPEQLGLNVGDVVDLQANEVALDKDGRADYKWQCGFPTLVSPYTRHFGINYKRANRTYVWSGIDGVVLGALPTGSNFVTQGPDHVLMVLRDPYGANSSTTWKTGKSMTKLTTKSRGFSGDEKLYTELVSGSELNTGVGFGVMIMSSAKNDVQGKVGIHVSTDMGSSTEETWTTTATMAVKTSATTDYVGANGDVFIGSSTNLIIGNCRKVGLFRADKDGEYSLRQVDALSTGDSISTTFMYTQQEIEMNQIPQWKKLRKELFIHVDTEEQARNYPPDANNPLYVTWLKEDDEHYGEPEYYAWIAPLNKPEVATSDSIMWLTNQIRNWEQVLSENEQDKVEAMKGAEYFDRNISFDSGAPSSYSERLDTTYTKKHTKNWTMRAITGVKTGVWVNAAATFGINLVADYENGGYNNEAYSNPEENYKTWAEMEYSLADANAGTHLSVNVYRSPRGWGDIFSVFGGQTYCPYEGEQRTRYYEKDKHVLSHATVQMDKPVLRVSVGDGLPAQTASVTDVPSGSSAIMTLHLTNDSDTKSDMYYNLAIGEKSNPQGLQIFVDGQSLTTGRSIMIPAGTTVRKQLEVRQTDLSILEYENVSLKLTSACQKAENGFFPSIVDVVTLNVNFMPSSSPIELVITEPVLNVQSDSTLHMKLKGFNRQFQNLKDVGVEYKYLGDTQWTVAHRYVTDPAELKSTTDSQMPETGDIALNLRMDNDQTYPDGHYTFRAFTTTPYGNEGDVKVYSKEIEVYKDLRRPQVLGTPSPTNGILTYGDDLSIEFNEDIIPDYVGDKNIIVTAKLNDQPVNYDVALHLEPDPGNNMCSTVNPIFLSGDISFDLWLKWSKPGTILRHGTGQNSFAVGIDNDGHLEVTISGTAFTSTKTLPTDKWTFLVVSFRTSDMTFSALAQYDEQSELLFDKQYVDLSSATTILYSDDNHLYIDCGTMEGAMHDLSFFKIYRDVYEAASMKNQSKNTYVYGLTNYWPMNEGHGNTAADVFHTHDFTVRDRWLLNNKNYGMEVGSYGGATADISQLNTGMGDSYAVELWASASSGRGKMGLADNAVLFETGTDSQNRLRLYYDQQRNVVLDYGTRSKIVAEHAYFYNGNDWHHMALNVVRGQTASFYVDGQRTAVIAEREVPGVAGQTMTFGKGFVGYMDEFRYWRANLSESRLLANHWNCIDTADVHSRGLALYFPFEKTGQENGVTTKVPTLENMAPGAKDTLKLADDELKLSTVSPPLKNAPEETLLIASPVASERRVVINVVNSAGSVVRPRDIEGTMLNITVDKIFDTHGNQSQPIRWTAYMQYNTLKWMKDSVNIIKNFGEETTFDVQIQNKSGNTEYYWIDNLPEWLTLVGSNVADEVAPLTTKTLRFRIDPLLRVGNYDLKIGLQGNYEIIEPLRVVMKVRGQMPEWSVDPTKYEHQMNFIGQVRINGILMENEESCVAAFVGDECRGVAYPEKVLGAAFVTMTVYGTGVQGADLNEPVSFRIWDASMGVAYTDAELYGSNGETIVPTFEPNGLKGDFDHPVIWTKSENVEQDLRLNTNWNWIALGVEPKDKAPSAVFNQLTSWRTIVKEKTGGVVYSNGSQWNGSLRDVEPATMYKMKLERLVDSKDLPAQLPVLGRQLKLSETPVTICNGWNWIAYTPLTTMPVRQALAGANPQQGDRIKSQTGIAIYSGWSWEGNLKSLESGHGYMYYSTDTDEAQKVFVYPDLTGEPSGSRAMETAWRAPALKVFTPVDPYAFADNMTMVVQLVSDYQVVDTAEVAAFVGEECRGAARAEDGLYYLVIAGEGSGQPMELRTCVDGEIVTIDTSLFFTADNNVGTPWEPYVVEMKAMPTGITQTTDDDDDRQWYDLQGRRIKGRPKHGVYIRTDRRHPAVPSQKMVVK